MLGVKVPSVVAIPLITPVVVFRFNPGGSMPLVTEKVGAGTPVAVTVTENGSPTRMLKVGGFGTVMTGGPRRVRTSSLPFGPPLYVMVNCCPAAVNVAPSGSPLNVPTIGLAAEIMVNRVPTETANPTDAIRFAAPPGAKVTVP